MFNLLVAQLFVTMQTVIRQGLTNTWIRCWAARWDSGIIWSPGPHSVLSLSGNLSFSSRFPLHYFSHGKLSSNYSSFKVAIHTPYLHVSLQVILMKKTLMQRWKGVLPWSQLLPQSLTKDPFILSNSRGKLSVCPGGICQCILLQLFPTVALPIEMSRW